MEEEIPSIGKQKEKSSLKKALKRRFGISRIEDCIIYPSEQKLGDIFKVVQYLGEGAFSIVVEVQNRETEDISALKVSKAFMWL